MLKKNIQIIKTHPVFIFRKLLKRVANLFKSGKARQCEINLGRVLDCAGNEKFENEKLLTERCNRPLTGIRRGWFSRVAPGGCCSVGRVNNPVKLEWFMLIRVKLLCCPHKRSVDLLFFFQRSNQVEWYAQLEIVSRRVEIKSKILTISTLQVRVMQFIATNFITLFYMFIMCNPLL